MRKLITFLLLFTLTLSCSEQEHKPKYRTKVVKDKTIDNRGRHLIAFTDMTSMLVTFGVYSNVEPGDTICQKEGVYWDIINCEDTLKNK